MKKIIIIIFLLVIMSFVFPDELEINVKKQPIFTSIISPGLFTTIGFGITNLLPNGRNEKSIIIRAGLGPFTLGGGIYFQYRFFNDSTRSGLFYTFDFGGDLIHVVGVGPGGGDVGFTRTFLPNIAGGIGYSKKIGDKTYLRISIDAGIKAVISNLNLSITF